MKRKYRLSLREKRRFVKTIHTPPFLIKIAENGLSYNRYAFVVSKQLDKRATARNRVRRVFRSCVEDARSDLAVGYDMLFVLKKPAMFIGADALSSFLKEAYQKGQLLV